MGKYSTVWIALVCCALCLVAGFAGCWFGFTYPVGVERDRAIVELERTRSTLESAIRRSAELERGLGTIAGIARSSTLTVNDALVQAGRITDAGKRIVYLVGVIRQVVADLRRIAEQGTPIAEP